MRGREPLAVWLLFGVVALEILVTYARVPAEELYHVTGSGLVGGVSRVIVFLNFPTALVAIAIVAVSYPRLTRRGRAVALAAAALCTPIFWPGVVSQAHLDARWVNAIPAFGVFLALVITATTARAPTDPRGDRGRIVLAALALLASPAWLAADLGFFLPWAARAPRPPPRDGRRATRALGASPLAAALRAAPADRGVPGADARLRHRQHRQRLLARADRQTRLDGLGGAVRARAAADVGLARDRRRGCGALGLVDQPLAAARSWANTSAISSALLTGVGRPVDPRLALLDRVDREDAEGHRHPGLDPGELEPDAASLATYSKCGVSPRTIAPSATTQA
jgi:hypothetical protein